MLQMLPIVFLLFACLSEPAFARAVERVIDASLIDTSRQSVGTNGVPDPDGRIIELRIRYSVDSASPAPLILISHGGTGSTDGYTRGEHIGEAFAQAGFIAVSVGHRASLPAGRHQADRPTDISFVIDAFEQQDVVLPADAPDIDLDSIGHAGHSYGAFTSHAVGGAVFEPIAGLSITRTDSRVKAIAPISPQGAGQFGFYDRGPTDNSWTSVNIPVCTFVGGAEINTNVLGNILSDGWRVEPHFRYSNEKDRLLFIIPDQSHSDMWSTGSQQVETFIAETAAQFFAFTLRDQGTIEGIGANPEVSGVLKLIRPSGFIVDPVPGCAFDANADGRIDTEDLYTVHSSPTDTNGDEQVDQQDIQCLSTELRSEEVEGGMRD